MTARSSEPTMVAPRAIGFHAHDRVPLRGTLFDPVDRPRSTVLIAGGLGITQRFYAPLSAWLAQRGHRVMTFDLRGMGASRLPPHTRSLRGLKADMLTWARQDFAAAVRYSSDASGEGRVGLLGHSLGMHPACMTDPVTQGSIRQAVSVAAGAGYWRDWAPPSRARAGNAPSKLQVLSPQQLGMASVGHVGAFRPDASTTLWPLIEKELTTGIP